jgi:hypothetical protein
MDETPDDIKNKRVKANIPKFSGKDYDIKYIRAKVH